MFSRLIYDVIHPLELYCADSQARATNAIDVTIHGYKKEVQAFPRRRLRLDRETKVLRLSSKLGVCQYNNN